MTLFDPWPDEDESIDPADRQATSTARPVREEAHARRADPVTSHAAAASITVRALTASQQVALELLRLAGPATLEQLVDFAHACEVRLSDSRIRSAVAELVDAAEAHDTGDRRSTRSGRAARVIAAGPAPTTTKEQSA